MLHIALNSNYDNYHLSVRNEAEFVIKSCIFKNSLTNEFKGGAINIEISKKVKLKNCVFEKCSATYFGGPFSITSESIDVYKVCCTSCWISERVDYHNGCAGYLNGSNTITHSLSSIYDCAPNDVSTPGNCVFAIHHSQKAQTKNVNASHSFFNGYIFYYVDECYSSFSTFDELDFTCLYFSSVHDINCHSCNLLRHRGGRGSLYGESNSNTLLVNNNIFFDNNVDVYTDNAKFILYNCCTNKSSFVNVENFNCSTRVTIYKTIIIEKANNCHEPFRNGSVEMVFHYTLLLAFLNTVIN